MSKLAPVLTSCAGLLLVVMVQDFVDICFKVAEGGRGDEDIVYSVLVVIPYSLSKVAYSSQHHDLVDHLTCNSSPHCLSILSLPGLHHDFCLSCKAYAREQSGVSGGTGVKSNQVL